MPLIACAIQLTEITHRICLVIATAAGENSARGRTVRDEVIGSGDASKSFQSFQLAKSPLTYLPDPSAPKGLRNTLEVFVDGQKWRQAASFYGAKPSDAIYVVRHDEDHETFVVFGDGELGRRLPTGVDNVVATYRYGVGCNVPANSITTLEKPIKGIRKVFNPLPATGGKEPPTREQLRREAPLSTLVLGRCISLLDFEAEARRFGNVVNAKARWGWDDAGETAVVNVWCATRDAGDPSAALGTYLAGLAEPGIALRVAKATPSVRVLRIELAIDPRFRAQEVELDVARHLFHDFDGILSTRNAVIGGPLVRSQVYAAIHTIRAARSHGKQRPRFPDEVGCRKTGIREERNARNETRDCRSPTSPRGSKRTCALS